MSSFVPPSAAPASVTAITSEHALNVVSIIDACLKALNNPRASNCNQSALCTWKSDEPTRTALRQIQGVAEVISNSCVKLCVLALSSANNPSVLDSLYDEVLNQLQAFITYYVQLRDCPSASDHLVALVLHSVRGQFNNVRELIHTIEVELIPTAAAKAKASKKSSTAASTTKDNKKESEEIDQMVRSATGKVMASHEELKALPQSNRNAIRRSVLEAIKEVKDVHREYSEYIVEAQEAHAVGNVSGGSSKAFGGKGTSAAAGDEEDEDEDEEDGMDDDYSEFESLPYTVTELQAVLQCVSRMEVVEGAMKLLSKSLTAVNDVMDGDVDGDGVDVGTVVAITALDATIVSDNTYSNEGKRLCEAKALSPSAIIQHGRHFTHVAVAKALLTAPLVVEALGSELHSPFDNQSIKERMTATTALCHKLLNYSKLLTDIFAAFIASSSAAAAADTTRHQELHAQMVQESDNFHLQLQTLSMNIV